MCDDGKDRKKRRLCQRLGRDCIYVSGRQRASGEMNGKSGNLNNCCRQIYPEGCTIPANEVICIMDADQARHPPVTDAMRRVAYRTPMQMMLKYS